MIVISPIQPSVEDRESETYGDYAEYLNAFASHRPATLKLVRMTPVQWRRLSRRPALTDSYAVVFVRRDGQALIFDGMPLEAALYEAGARWASNGSTPANELGLAPVMLRRSR